MTLCKTSAGFKEIIALKEITNARRLPSIIAINHPTQQRIPCAYGNGEITAMHESFRQFAIKRMLHSRLIEETPGDTPRRKFYTLTDEGRKSLSVELQRYNDAVELARRKDLFESLGLSG